MAQGISPNVAINGTGERRGAPGEFTGIKVLMHEWKKGEYVKGTNRTVVIQSPLPFNLDQLAEKVVQGVRELRQNVGYAQKPKTVFVV